MRVYHFRSKEHGLLAIEKQQLKVGKINDLNDPYELLATDFSDENERERFFRWKNEISERIGFLSFSKNMVSPLLWSHYADRHRGVALILDIDIDLLIPVSYCSNRISLNIGQIMQRGGFSAELAERLGSTKSLHWSYEEELRVAISLPECIFENGHMFEPISDQLKIVGVMAGALSDLTYEEVENRLPRGMSLEFSHARMDNLSFDIVQDIEQSVKVIEGKT
jgi:hypothetical protein